MRILTASDKIQNEVTRRRTRADRRARERAATLGARIIEDVSRAEIRRRDGDYCYLCLQFVSVHDETIDHLLPLKRGGDHTKDNIRIVHRGCNSKKGNRLLSELDLSKF